VATQAASFFGLFSAVVIFRCRYLPLICRWVAGAWWHRARVSSDLFSPEFDASFGGGCGPEVDREGADEGDVFRALSTSKARWVVFERHFENRLFSMAHWRRPHARLADEIQVGEVLLQVPLRQLARAIWQ
jgi:hypothetical protein